MTLIGEAVFARALSALKEERLVASGILQGPDSPDLTNETDSWKETLGHALFAAKIVSYTQGYMLMRAAAEEYGWELRYGAIAQMWRGGCIIRSAFLDDIKAAFDKQADLASLLIDDYFRDQVHESPFTTVTVLLVYQLIFFRRSATISARILIRSSMVMAVGIIQTGSEVAVVCRAQVTTPEEESIFVTLQPQPYARLPKQHGEYYGQIGNRCNMSNQYQA